MGTISPYLINGGVTPFPYPMTPMNATTPLTFREGITFQAMLEQLRYWVENSVAVEFVDAINKAIDDFQKGITNAENTIIASKVEWQNLFDEFMENVVIRLEALNDQAVANNVDNPATETAKALNDFVYSKTLGEQKTANKTYTSEKVLLDGVVAEHNIIRLFGATNSRHSLQHLMGQDSTDVLNAPAETIASYYDRSGADVIINASAWWVDTFRRVGLTIKDGTLLQDWEVGTDWGIESFVSFKDGHVELCERAVESGAQLIARGAWNSWTFGRIALKNGVDMGLRSNPKYQGVTGRQCIGWDSKGAICILTFPGATGSYGATIQDVYNIAAQYGINNLYMLDGGGSTQAIVEGSNVVPSSDTTPRAVPDALAFSGSRSNGYYGHSGWQNLILPDGVTVMPTPSGYHADARIVTHGNHQECVIRLNIQGVVSGATAFTLPRQAMWPKINASFIGVSNAGVLVPMNINAFGTCTVVGTGLTADKIIRGEFRYTLG